MVSNHNHVQHNQQIHLHVVHQSHTHIHVTSHIPINTTQTTLQHMPFPFPYHYSMSCVAKASVREVKLPRPPPPGLHSPASSPPHPSPTHLAINTIHAAGLDSGLYSHQTYNCPQLTHGLKK